MESKELRYGLGVLAVLTVGVALRVYQFPHLPPGFNQDEAASAYEAWSLAETGCDKWGNAWPAYFPSWGSGQNVLLAYLTAPVIKVLGLSVLSARLVLLLTSLLTLPLFFVCLRPLGRARALLGLLILALAPWHVLLARWALESNLLPFWMLLGIVTLARALTTGRRRWIGPALLPFAVALYAYGTTAVVLPLLLGGALVVFRAQLHRHWRVWLLALGLFLLVAGPFLLFFLENYLLHRNLAWTDSLPFSTPLLPATRISQINSDSWPTMLFKNWKFLIRGFNDGMCYNQLPGFALLIRGALPLAIIGWVATLREMNAIVRSGAALSPPATVRALFALWAGAAFTLALTVELNINRFNHFFLPCLVLAMVGLDVLLNKVPKPATRQILWRVAVGLISLDGVLAATTYFTTYPKSEISTAFNTGLEDAFAAVTRLPVRQVLITDQLPLPYVYTAFFTRYPPRDFQRAVRYRAVNGVYEVSRLGRYVFARQALDPQQSYGYLIDRNALPAAEPGSRRILYRSARWEVGIVAATRD